MSTLSDHNPESSRVKEYNTKSSLFNNRDPDRYYLEEYFKQLPSSNNTNVSDSSIFSSSTIDVTADAIDNTGTLTQPANTILVDAGVIVIGTFTTGAAATDLDIGTNASGAEIVSGGGALGAGSASIDSNTIASVGNTGKPVTGATTISFVDAAPLFTDSSRTIYFTLDKNSAAVSSAGTVKFFIKFASTNSTYASSSFPAQSNTDFELAGTNHSTGTIGYSTTYGGFEITTAGADDDQMIIQPHQNTNQSAWNNVYFNTQDEVVWECAIRTAAISTSNTAFWAGLKKTNTGVYATDTDQAYFLFSGHSDDDLGTITTNANLHFVYSVSNTDYITDLGITFDADTVYKLKIVIDADRKVTAYVNGKVYGLVTSNTAGGTTQSISGQKSLALTTAVRLYPFIGLQALSASSPTITVCYEKISRTIV